MEITLRTQTPVYFRRSDQLNFRPLFTGWSFSRSSIRFSQSPSLDIQYRANGIFYPFCASGDFSSKRQKKRSRRRSRGRSSIGFVPKALAERDSEKREQLNSEDSIPSVIPPEVDCMAPDSKCGSFGGDILEVSQGKCGEGTINWKAGNLPPVNNLKAVDRKNMLKARESVKGFIEKGEKSSGTVFDEGDEGNSIVEINPNIKADENVTESIFLGSETQGFPSITNDKKGDALYNVSKNRTLGSHQKIEADNYVKGCKVLVSETSSGDRISSEKEVNVSVSNQETVENECNELEKIVTETKLMGLETLDSVTLVSDKKEVRDRHVAETELLSSETTCSVAESGDKKEEKDLVIFQENLTLVCSGKGESTEISLGSETRVSDSVTIGQKEVSLKSFDTIESNKDVNYSELLSSETMGPDTFTSDDKEAKDSTSIPENMAVVDENINETGVVGSETKDTINIDVKELEESLQKLDSEMEASMCKQVLADENFSKGKKMFIYPEIAKPDHKIEMFYNRSLSSLKNEPDVMIMGAFNDWRWKSFTLRLEKTHLKGDWWACQIHVPKEAYKIDFVFCNGRGIYDNNKKKDFHITVEGGMSMLTFEEFLVEDKNREIEKLLKEQAERERQSEEQRQRDEERAATAAVLAKAKLEVERKREKLRLLMNIPIALAENVCFFEPREFKGGDVVRLYYNKISGPLAQARDIWIHGGHNNWEDGISIMSRLVKSEDKNAHLWYIEVTVPKQAFILDWIFTDGPPQNASIYDNNDCQDFHAIVPTYIRDELYRVEEEHRICQRLQEERRAREEAIRAKAEKTARMKLELKEQTQNTFLVSQRHIVYTDPVDVQAGCDVTVYYNPSNTVLNGKAEVWFRCSFNHWTHRRGPLSPQKMLPTGNGCHVKTTVKVPLDAYMMDFVFSERQDGGTFDNKNDMDYHVPVFGGIAKEPPIHIVHIAVEMAPIAKVGGLGDIVTSLSRAVQDLNHHVEIVFPKYDCLNQNHVKDLHYQKSYPWEGIDIKVWFGKVEGLSVYFLDPQNGLFSSGNIYAGLNDGARFGFFCRAALEFLQKMGFNPDIIHCHDWTSAPVAWMHKEHYANSLSNARVIFTIHNLEFGAILIGKAMAYADKATTVSSTYSKEVAEDPAIAPHLYKFHGILNGIDPEIWDPYNDNFIPVSYTSDNVVEGKKAAKELLQQRLSLKKADVPLVGIISRLTHQKGIHLIKHAIWHTLERGGQVVLLGSASDPLVQSDFLDLSNQMHNLHCDRARLCLTYDEPLSHLIYAGADFILVPSIFEPCGLTQLVAMRYGSIPVVRKTGGLYDTVFDVDDEQERAKSLGMEPNGFNFEGADPAGLNYALDRAISSWYDGKEWLNALRKRVMEQDWSWNRPALEYIELYHAARKC